jgi:hypothetical protein
MVCTCLSGSFAWIRTREPDFPGLVLLSDLMDNVVKVDLAGGRQDPHCQHSHLAKACVENEIKLK